MGIYVHACAFSHLHFRPLSSKLAPIESHRTRYGSQTPQPERSDSNIRPDLEALPDMESRTEVEIAGGKQALVCHLTIKIHLIGVQQLNPFCVSLLRNSLTPFKWWFCL